MRELLFARWPHCAPACVSELRLVVLSCGWLVGVRCCVLNVVCADRCVIYLNV